MTTPKPETKAEYIRRMADDGLGGLGSQAQVDANIASSFEDIAIVLTDEGDIPSSASSRTNGTFSDAESAHEYLERGGLVVTDGAGNTEPIGFVYVLKWFDDILNEWVWSVYIDDDTG